MRTQHIWFDLEFTVVDIAIDALSVFQYMCAIVTLHYTYSVHIRVIGSRTDVADAFYA